MTAPSIQIQRKRYYNSSVHTNIFYMELLQFCQYRYDVNGTITALSIQIYCTWNYGRCQYRYGVNGTMTVPSIQYDLNGTMTVLSIQMCCTWNYDGTVNTDRRKRNYGISINTDILYIEL